MLATGQPGCRRRATAAQAEPVAGLRERRLTALVDTLPAEVLPLAQAEPDAGLRERRLTALADTLPAEVLAQARAAVQAEPDVWWRAPRLTALAPHLARHASRADFLRTLRVLAARGRPDLLSDLTALLPWIAALTTEAERAELAQAVINVGRCWS